jgi:hypothetical protein
MTFFLKKLNYLMHLVGMFGTLLFMLIFAGLVELRAPWILHYLHYLLIYMTMFGTGSMFIILFKDALRC